MIDPNSRSLVLSCAVSYDRQTLRAFVSSFRRHVTNADLIVFANDLGPDTVSWLIDKDVRILPWELHHVRIDTGWKKALRFVALRASSRFFRMWLKWLCGPSDQRGQLAQHSMLAINSARWRAYYAFLQLHGWKYKDVLIIDSRDAIFQTNPFPVSGLHAFGEKDRIGESHFAKRWLQLTYGHARWHALKNKPFLCSGAVLGGIQEMMHLTDVMQSECRRVMAVGGEDQAVYNVLIHENRVKAVVHPFGEGPIINLNAASPEELRIKQGCLTNSTNQPYAIVHQYDRVSGLAEKLANITDSFESPANIL